MSAAIPNQLHFVWIGRSLPWFAQLAIQSALTACPHARVSLWAEADLEADANLRPLREEPRFSLARLNERTLLDCAPSNLRLELPARLFASLTQPAARANLARLLLLYRFGGIYLDTDTLTLRDLSPLRELSGFCGLEHVVWPLEKRYGLHSYRILGGPLRGLVRQLCARLPGGERAFTRVADWYATAANNAVLGFAPGHPFLTHLLEMVSALRPEELTLRYRLGTHLLQQALRDSAARHAVHALPPQAFYPLGPELSRQYFRKRPDVAEVAAAIVAQDTYLVHWYASVSELARYDAARVMRERDQTLFAHLAAKALVDARVAAEAELAAS